MEWKVVCGRYLVTAKEVGGATERTYLRPVPKGVNELDMFEPLLSGLLRLANGSWVTGIAKVLVYDTGDKVYIPLFECLSPTEHEFDLWGIGGF